MGKLETPPEGDKGHLTSSPALPPVQSQPTSTNGGTPQPGPASDHMASVTSQFDIGMDSIPAVAFPPLAKIPEINTVPSSQHVTNVAPQPNDMQNMAAGGVSGVTMGQTPGMMLSSSVRQEPVTLVPAVGAPWHSGLFDCFQHPTNALITTIAPCVTFGQIAEILDNGSTSCVTGGMLYLLLILGICHWNIGFRYRRRLRNAYNLSETPLTDRLAHIYFPACALCQEFRELKNRGLDPLLGYQGVIAQRQHEELQQQIGNNPPANQIMMR